MWNSVWGVPSSVLKVTRPNLRKRERERERERTQHRTEESVLDITVGYSGYDDVAVGFGD